MQASRMQASRKPRRSFAAPLVITAAALPACIVTPGPTTSSPPPNVTTTDHRTPDQPPPGPNPSTSHNPPMPNPNPAPSYERDWTVTVGSDGVCHAAIKVSCPKPPATCNPPMPVQVACPDGMTAGQTMEIYAEANSWDCYIRPAPMACPHNATCNPPMPARTACPQ